MAAEPCMTILPSVPGYSALSFNLAFFDEHMDIHAIREEVLALPIIGWRVTAWTEDDVRYEAIEPLTVGAIEWTWKADADRLDSIECPDGRVIGEANEVYASRAAFLKAAVAEARRRARDAAARDAASCVITAADEAAVDESAAEPAPAWPGSVVAVGA